MKRYPAAMVLLTLATAALPGEDRARTLDLDSARSKLAGEVTKTPGRFVTKGLGGDPVSTRICRKDVVVVTHASGAKETHPFIAVPLLFKTNTDELLDDVPRENLAKLAALLPELATSSFAIEGHASAEGDAQRNRELSKIDVAGKCQTASISGTNYLVPA